MKRKLTLVLSLLFAGFGNANSQDILVQDVPSLVKSSFDKAFTKASKVEWEMKGNLYNAEFEMGRRDYEVWLDNKGTFVKVKKELRSKELPTAVLNSVKQNYKGYRIADVDRFEENKQFFYKIELKKLTEEVDIYLDQNGKKVTKVL